MRSCSLQRVDVLWLYEKVWSGRADHRAYVLQEVAGTHITHAEEGRAGKETAP